MTEMIIIHIQQHVISKYTYTALRTPISIRVIVIHFYSEKPKKKEPKDKGKKKKKSKKQRNVDDEASEDSDDLDEGKEVDYMTDSDRWVTIGHVILAAITGTTLWVSAKKT